MRIAVLGEGMVELFGIDIAKRTTQLGFAGDALNFAVYLARALNSADAKVSFFTVLGTDVFSDGMLTMMREEGLDVSYVGRDPDKLPGIYAIETDETGERRFHYWRKQSAARTLFSGTHPTLDNLQTFDVVYLSGITLAILPPNVRSQLTNVCRDLKSSGRSVIIDSNYRSVLWEDRDTARTVLEQFTEAATLALPSADDESELWEDATPEAIFNRLSARGVHEIVLKNGASGPLLLPVSQFPRERFPAAERVVDTTAAGDSFNAGYVAARLTGSDRPAAARAGHALARLVVAERGAIVDVAIPSLR